MGFAGDRATSRRGKPEPLRAAAWLTILPNSAGSLARLVGHRRDADSCAVCHGPEGQGNKELGAPNLTDGISLFGSDEAAIIEVIANSRGGVMPAWTDRLDPMTIKALAFYVHALGGGEK